MTDSTLSPADLATLPPLRSLSEVALDVLQGAVDVWHEAGLTTVTVPLATLADLIALARGRTA